MQSQMIGMQSSLDRILSAIQSQNQALAQGPGPAYPPSSRESPVVAPPVPVPMPAPQGDGPPRPRAFPALPGFAPPVRVNTPPCMTGEPC